MGGKPFLCFGLCAEIPIYVPNTEMCYLGDLVSSLALTDNKVRTVLYPVNCSVQLMPLKQNIYIFPFFASIVKSLV